MIFLFCSRLNDQEQTSQNWSLGNNVVRRVLLMNAIKLGKLEKGDLRKIWLHEAIDFTNWLALEENLRLLSDEIGIDITLIQTEALVGKFSADILAEEENTDRKIIIENQLEAPNHDHL